MNSGGVAVPAPPAALGLATRMRRLSLRARLALLVVAGVLPLLLYNLGTVYADYRRERDRVSRQSLELAHGLALAVEGELKARIASLEVLALAGSLARGDLDAFRRQAEAVVALQQPGSNILLLRADGQQLVNTAMPAGAPLPVRRSLSNQQRVLATGRPSVSDLYEGLVVKRPVVAIEVPVRREDGTVEMVLGMNPSLTAFDDIIRRQQPGEGWLISLIDRNGTRIARVPGGEDLVGQPVSDGFRRGANGSEGVLQVISTEGMPVLGSYRRLAEHGWTVTVFLATSKLTAPALYAGGMALAVGLGLLGFGLLLAHRVAQGITGPIAALQRFAATTDGPEPPLPLRTDLAEVDEVADALLAQARRRRAAAGSLADSERRLRLVVGELNHRAKNALSTVLALAHQTSRSAAGADSKTFIEAFTARLRGLARAHDLLAARSWKRLELESVVQAGLAPWLDGFNASHARIRVNCQPRNMLPRTSPTQAQALILALHELATNAMKHGALSVAGGIVHITCRAGEAEDTAVLEWREQGGPPVAAPSNEHRGFGTRMLTRGLARDLGPQGSIILDFAAAGLVARIGYAAEDDALAAAE